MDKLVAEPEVETKVETKLQEIKKEESSQLEENVEEGQQETKIEIGQKLKIKVSPPKEEEVSANNYLNSFENLTLADIKRDRDEKAAEKFKEEKEKLIELQFAEVENLQYSETKSESSKRVIEKPNFDLIEENSKILKIKSKTKAKEKKRPRKKLSAIVLACVLGASTIVCVANTVALEDMYSSYVEMGETYNFNLQKYLKNINNLDATKKSMEFIETYPDDLLDAGDVGIKSNWFDRICNFISGIFGG